LGGQPQALPAFLAAALLCASAAAPLFLESGLHGLSTVALGAAIAFIAPVIAPRMGAPPPAAFLFLVSLSAVLAAAFAGWLRRRRSLERPA
jgi:membrane protein implicated in regulation of membrane protease activity